MKKHIILLLLISVLIASCGKEKTENEKFTSYNSSMQEVLKSDELQKAVNENNVDKVSKLYNEEKEKLLKKSGIKSDSSLKNLETKIKSDTTFKSDTAIKSKTDEIDRLRLKYFYTLYIVYMKSPDYKNSFLNKDTKKGAEERDASNTGYLRALGFTAFPEMEALQRKFASDPEIMKLKEVLDQTSREVMSAVSEELNKRN